MTTWLTSNRSSSLVSLAPWSLDGRNSGLVRGDKGSWPTNHGELEGWGTDHH